MEMKSFVRANLDRVVAVVLVAVGVLAIVIGWIGVSGTGLAPEQIPYVISGGIGGLALIALGCTAWVSADLQDEWRRLDAIEEHLQRLDRAPGPAVPHGDDAVRANGKAPSRGRRVRVTTDAQA